MRPSPATLRTIGAAAGAAVAGSIGGRLLELTIWQGATLAASLFLLAAWCASAAGLPCWSHLDDCRVGTALFVAVTALFAWSFLSFEPIESICEIGRPMRPRFLSAFVSYAPSLPYGVSRLVELVTSGRRA